MCPARLAKAIGNATIPQTSLRRVLVVEDVPEICDMYRSIFRRSPLLDADLSIETDPLVAIQRLREASFDLVISDFRMKGADGIDVLVAAHAAHPAGRRVLMTGYDEVPTSTDRIQAAHIDATLQKPISTRALVAVILEMLDGPLAIPGGWR